MNSKFDQIVCNGVVYDRDFVLKEIEKWISENVIMQYQVMRIVKENVKPELFKMFNIPAHRPIEYKELGLNGINFVSNIILEAGLASGREEKEIEYKNILRSKNEELAQKDAYIKDLERQLQNKVKIKK